MDFKWVEWYKNDGKKIRSIDTATCEVRSMYEAETNQRLNDNKTMFSCFKLVPNCALFAGREDGSIMTWKYSVSGHAEGQGIRTKGHSGALKSLEFFNSGTDEAGSRLLFTGSADRTIKMWDLWSMNRDEACIQTLTGHNGTIIDLKFGPDKCLMSCSNDGTIRIWKALEGRQLLLYPWFSLLQTIEPRGRSPTAIATRTGGSSLLFVGQTDGSIGVYAKVDESDRTITQRVTRFEQKRQYTGIHERGITQLLVISEQNLIVSLSYDNTIQVLNALTGARMASIRNNTRARFIFCDWNSARSTLLAIDSAGTVSVWDISTEHCLKSQKVLVNTAIGLCTIPRYDMYDWISQRSFSNVESTRKDEFMAISTHECKMFQISRELGCTELKGHTEAVVAVVVVPESDGSLPLLFSASLDGTIRRWDLHTMEVAYGFTEKESEIICMTYLPLSNRLATGNEDGSIRLWNINSGTYQTITQHSNSVTALTVAQIKSDEYLISGGYDGKVCVWDQRDREGASPALHHVSQAYSGEGSEILSLYFIPGLNEMNTFATGSNSGVIKIWNIRGQELLKELDGHQGAVTCMALDAMFLFTGSDDCTIRIWNLSTISDAYQLGRIEAHRESIRDLIFIEDLGCLVSCAYDGYIRLWAYDEQDTTDTDQCGRLLRQMAHPEKFKCLAYQQHQIVCGTEDASIVLFPIPTSITEKIE